MSYLEFIKTEKVENKPIKTPGEIKNDSQARLGQFRREFNPQKLELAKGWFNTRAEA